jgi:hypothetical protein
MLVSRINLPDAIHGVSAERLDAFRKLVEQCDLILTEEGSRFKGGTLRATWSMDSDQYLDRAMLHVWLGLANMGAYIPRSVLNTFYAGIPSFSSLGSSSNRGMRRSLMAIAS